jgi:PhnB protein
MPSVNKIYSAIFITFNGNCKKALAFYQNCFGGNLYFDIFDKSIAGIDESPVVSGSLLSKKISVYGSDLVHNEGRRVGNFMSIYIHCDDFSERLEYIKKLDNNQNDYNSKKYAGQKWIEISDPFDVHWVFGI